MKCPCLLIPLLVFCQSLAADERVAIASMAEAAQSFLASTHSEQRAKLMLEFADDGRTDWHYVPKQRKGLSLAEMSEAQQSLAWDFLNSALSESGSEKARGVIAAERVLWERSNHSEFRNPEKYHLVFFAEPKVDANWGCSFEGHHLSINLTVVDGTQVFVTPSFFGSNPDDDGAGNRPLAAELDQALELLHLLDAEQLKQAILHGKAPREVLSKAQRQVKAMALEGLPASAMTPPQQAQLLQLIQEYVGRYRQAFAADDLKKISDAGMENIHFVWAGATERGQAIYYRVQGPTFMLEYANTQGGANHAHTVWRDFEHDFGYDALHEHYDAGH